jgi:L-serine dehydratase
MRLSVFEIFKIGIGPSSSHTTGPMRAARLFLERLDRAGRLDRVDRLAVTLMGSLALTGAGHATDRAVLLGLMGETPEAVMPEEVEPRLQRARGGNLALLGRHPLPFVRLDLTSDRSRRKLTHPNTMRFVAYDSDGAVLADESWLSPGGSFVRLASEEGADPTPGRIAHPFKTALDLLEATARTGLSIAELVRANETALNPCRDIDGSLDTIIEAMMAAIDRGMAADGALPGALRLKRRAPALAAALGAHGRNDAPAFSALDRVTVYALSVNEENAAGGRVVTAPTNGACGVVPAVLRYAMDDEGFDWSAARQFLLTGAAIGMLAKTNASISGAEVGCQGEVGVAAAMAAAGYAAVRGGTPAQVENAAEIALEHHLGMTCDPVLGLVQIPCIERNAMGAVKALAAASLALKGNGAHLVSLDAVIETMRQTGADMRRKYRETALGGLAVNVTVC